jgi:hypothetical protein
VRSLVTAEELEAPVGDKFIGRHLIFELDLYNKERLRGAIAMLELLNPQHHFTYVPSNVSEPEGFHVRWQPA